MTRTLPAVAAAPCHDWHPTQKRDEQVCALCKAWCQRDGKGVIVAYCAHQSQSREI